MRPLRGNIPLAGVHFRGLSAPKNVLLYGAKTWQLRKDKAQLHQQLQTLLKAQETEIAHHVKKAAHARHKLATLVKTASGYPDTLLRTVGKASVDVLPRMIWIYEYDRRGDDDWRTAKREAKRFVRQLRQASAQHVAVEAP